MTPQEPGGESLTWEVNHHRARSRKPYLALAAGAAMVLLAAGLTGLVWQPVAAERPVWAQAQPTATELALPTAAASVDPGPPTRVRIAKIEVDSVLEDLGLDQAGALAAPVDFNKAGWYSGGTRPGDVGPAVIAGHVDSVHGRAVFYRLRELKSGDLIEVQRGGEWLEFQVVGTGRFAKDHFPTAEVYGPTPDPQLRLITCGGVFDEQRHSYLDNVVVFAVAR